MSKKELTRVETRRAEQVDSADAAAPAVGKWYWVKEPDEEEEWLGCVVKIGSNYAKLQSPHCSTRVHFDDFFARCRYEPEHEAVIDGRVDAARSRIKVLNAKVRELTDRLAITPGLALGDGGETSALALRGNSEPVDEYKAALAEAREETLPELFSEIRRQGELMREWLTATTLPLQAQADALDPILDAIKNRIFSVELYSGLVEQVEQVADGEPAPMTEKIHLMQRRCYMDEECLAEYETGGMDISSLEKFDAWLARPSNRDRILPHPRCLVAFRVRRSTKQRDAWDLADFLQVLDEEKLDKWTYLYMRNGEKLFRLRTGIEFDAQLFPDAEHSVIDDAIYADLGHEKIISENEYLAMVEEEDREIAEAGWQVSDHARFSRDSRDYKPFRQESVFYDDIAEMVQKRMARHNRLVLVLQGILDRSPVFHPHPPWQVWTNDGFVQALVLVYDDSRALVAGEKPDFEAYRRRLNASLRAGSITVGQQVAWELSEGEKEMRRQKQKGLQGWYLYEGRRVRPSGNPGPGRVARVVAFGKKSRKCTYAWMRKGGYDYRRGVDRDDVRCSFEASPEDLLCVDAYRPGDFKVFFADPRTRAEYLQWAPMLLAAEEYHAGNAKLVEPPVPTPKKETSEESRWRYQKMLQRRAMDGKVVRLLQPITRRDGKKFEKGTLWIARKERGDAFNIHGCDALGRRTKDDRFVRSVDIGDIAVIDPQPTLPKKEG